MKKLTLTITLTLAMSVSAWADYLGCFEPNEAVEIKTLYLNSTGVLTDPTSPACDILDPNDTTLTSCTSGPTKVGSLTGIYESSHTIPASPLEGVWIVKQKGTVDGTVKDAADYFMVVDVAGECPGRAGVKIAAITHTGAVIPTVTAVTNDVGITQTGADKVWGTATRTITGGTIGTYTGNTPQTGDSYAIVNSGTYGNSALNTKINTIDDFLDTEIAAIIAYMDTEIADILEDTADMQPKLGTPVVDLSTDIVTAQADLDDLQLKALSTAAAGNINSAYSGVGYMGEGIAVTIASVASALPRVITITETTIITVDNQFVGRELYCSTNKEGRKIIATDNNTADTITVDYGNFFTVDPINTCYIK